MRGEGWESFYQGGKFYSEPSYSKLYITHAKPLPLPLEQKLNTF